MKTIFLFLILLTNGITDISAQSRMSQTTGEFIVSRNILATEDVALIVSNRHTRFNVKKPASKIPTQAVGVFDIFTDTPTERTVLGFGEFREVTDATSPLYNTVEATDPVGAHFFFTKKDDMLLLQTRTGSAWAVATSNIFIFGIAGNVIAAAPASSYANPSSLPTGYKLWIQGNNTLMVAGAIDGPIGGGRVPIQSQESQYMTFAIETSSDAQKKWLQWYYYDGATQVGMREFLIQDTGATIPYSALGNSSEPKTFIIDHPIDSDRYLVHAAIEGPQNRVFYRGKTTLQNGESFVTLPDYFEGLTQENHRAVFLQNMSGFDKITVKTQRGQRIKNGVLHIVSQDKRSQAIVSWEVSAVRKDVPDLIVAPRTDEVDVLGFGPYRYVVPRK